MRVSWCISYIQFLIFSALRAELDFLFLLFRPGYCLFLLLSMSSFVIVATCVWGLRVFVHV